MLTRYIEEAMRRARYKLLANGEVFGEIPSLQGVWANAASLDACRDELQQVLEGWLILKLRDGDPIPRLGRTQISRAA